MTPLPPTLISRLRTLLLSPRPKEGSRRHKPNWDHESRSIRRRWVPGQGESNFDELADDRAVESAVRATFRLNGLRYRPLDRQSLISERGERHEDYPH